jgi:hypothetical protein
MAGRIRFLSAVVTIVVAGAFSPVAGAATGGTPAGPAPASVWNPAAQLPGSGPLNTGGDAYAQAISCPAAGSCTAGGAYSLPSGQDEPFVDGVSTSNWLTTTELPGARSLNRGAVSGINAISCPSTGNCVAGGVYTDASGGQQAMLATESGGAWQAALEVPGTAALNVDGNAEVTSVACASVGNCVAGGSYEDVNGNSQGFVVDEVAGSWGSATELPGLGALNVGGLALVSAMACGTTAGSCTAAGTYVDASGLTQSFVADQVTGTWQSAVIVPGTTALDAGNGSVDLGALSCSSAGNCAVGGSYVDVSGNTQVYVANEVAGAWSDAEALPGAVALNASGVATVTALSCGADGNCAVGGLYDEGSGSSQVFIANESAGTWGTAIEEPGTAALNRGDSASIDDLSCAAAGSCAAGGYYTDAAGAIHSFVAVAAGGTWSNAVQVPGAPVGGEVVALSCATTTYCGAVGTYFVGNTLQTFETTFAPPVPAVSHVTPSSSNSVAGIHAIVYGTHLTGATLVLFGSHRATAVTVVDPDAIRVTVPAGTGVVHVRVVTPYGTSATPPGSQFTYR